MANTMQQGSLKGICIAHDELTGKFNAAELNGVTTVTSAGMLLAISVDGSAHQFETGFGCARLQPGQTSLLHQFRHRRTVSGWRHLFRLHHNVVPA